MKDDLNLIRDVWKEIIAGTLDRAGKGKDEVIKILGKEIGQALAAMLKEPLSQLVKTRKINISIELAERSADLSLGDSPKPPAKRAKRTSSKASGKNLR